MKTKANRTAPELMADVIMQDEMYREETDAFIKHNRRALNRAMDEAYDDIDENRVSAFSIDAVIEEGRKLHDERRKIR